jgi:HD superfamily phosphohydrolase
MYFAFLWMDRWLKIMEALTAEQERFAQSRSEDKTAPDDELVNLRSALMDRDHALLAALRHGKELETALARQRDAAEQRGADYLREIAERTRVAEEAEEWLRRNCRRHTFEGVRAAHLIFNDDHGHQTANLHRDRSGFLAADGIWYDERPKAVG